MGRRKWPRRPPFDQPATADRKRGARRPNGNGRARGSGRDYAFNEWELHPNRAGVQLSLRCVRTKTHKLTWEALTDSGELYDLANDPQEMDNRWNDPGV